MNPATPWLLACVHEAQKGTADLLGQRLSQEGARPDFDQRHRLQRLALADICETLLWRAAQEIARAPACAQASAVNAPTFVKAHLHAALMSWLMGAAETTAERQVLMDCLAQFGVGPSSPLLFPE